MKENKCTIHWDSCEELINKYEKIIQMKENQDIITINGKKHEFIELFKIIGNKCTKCSLHYEGQSNCPHPCLPKEREDNKDGYFKLKIYKNLPINLVPESIKIIDCSDNEFGLGLIFNNNQILTYDKASNNYIVGIKGLLDKITPCQFIETKFKDIQAGDIYIEYGMNNLNPSNYYLRLAGKEYAKVNIKKNVEVYECCTHKNQNVLKVITY